MKKTNRTNRTTLKVLALLFFTGLAVYIILPQLTNFNSSLHSLKKANLWLMFAAALIFALSYLVATTTICLLSIFKLSFKSAFLVQIADGFTNKLVPAGIGAVTTNFLFLKKQSKSNIKAGYVAVANNVIGMVAHLILLILLLLINSQNNSTDFQFKHPQFSRTIILIAIASVIVLFIIWQRFRFPVHKSLASLNLAIKAGLNQPARLIGSLFSSMLLTMLYAITLYFVVIGLKINISFMQTFLIFTVSVIALSIVPTPGGIGGVEASLVAALIASGVDSGPALTAALAYRLITYWLPILPGAVALHYASKKQLLSRTGN